MNNERLFPNSSPPTHESTKKWLMDFVLLNEDRILFSVLSKNGVWCGHLGIWIREGEIFELDNVIKAESCNTKGLFSEATKLLGRWMSEFSGIRYLSLRVLNTNLKALDFYSKLSFIEVSQTPVDSDKSSKDFWVKMNVDLELWGDTDEHVLTAGPSMGPFEVAMVSDATKTGWNHHHSDYLNKFTRDFATYVEADFAIPTDSCTSALHLAMWALDIGPGDEVIVPEITWVATANAVRYVGATPIFADVDPVTWCIDPDSVESLITSRTKAIIPVHLYGYVADINRLDKLCEKHGIKLVQDAAPGIGSMIDGRGVATKGTYSCFSFQGAKLLVSGEGGVLTTNDENLFARAFKIGDSGRRPGTFWIEMLGKKMKMSNLTASLALAQMQSAERQIAKKRQIRDWYLEEFLGIEGLRIQGELVNTRSICWMTSLFVDFPGYSRDEFRKELLDNGIDTRPVFSPISEYPIWERNLLQQPNAKLIGGNAINLPSGVALSRSTVAKVGEGVRKALDKL